MNDNNGESSTPPMESDDVKAPIHDILSHDDKQTLERLSKTINYEFVNRRPKASAWTKVAFPLALAIIIAGLVAAGIRRIRSTSEPSLAYSSDATDQPILGLVYAVPFQENGVEKIKSGAYSKWFYDDEDKQLLLLAESELSLYRKDGKIDRMSLRGLGVISESSIPIDYDNDFLTATPKGTRYSIKTRGTKTILHVENESVRVKGYIADKSCKIMRPIDEVIEEQGSLESYRCDGEAKAKLINIAVASASVSPSKDTTVTDETLRGILQTEIEKIKSGLSRCKRGTMPATISARKFGLSKVSIESADDNVDIDCIVNEVNSSPAISEIDSSKVIEVSVEI